MQLCWSNLDGIFYFYCIDFRYVSYLKQKKKKGFINIPPYIKNLKSLYDNYDGIKYRLWTLILNLYTSNLGF